MAEILKGAPVAAALNERMSSQVEELKKKNTEPCLAILRVGQRDDNISYERGATKRCDAVGVKVRKVTLPEDVEPNRFYEILESLNCDDSIHGILMFRPLPEQLDDERARKMLSPKKDVDGCTDSSLAGVFTGCNEGFTPCTAQAAMEILDHYGIDCTGKRAVVIGRSLVVGRPAAMLLMHRNATVTVCHTRTVDMENIAGEADILIVCSGKMESIGASYLRENQIVIDVGIGWNDAKGKLCGDVKFDEAEPIVGAITPVPGGVGAVTTGVLVSHVVEAAVKSVQ